MKNINSLDQIKNLDEYINEILIDFNLEKKHYYTSISDKIRNLVECLKVFISDDKNSYYDWGLIYKHKNQIFNRSIYYILNDLYEAAEINTVHYTLNSDSSERFLYNLYPYLIELKEILEKEYNLHILKNIEKLKFNYVSCNLDYYKKVYEKIKNLTSTNIEPIFVYIESCTPKIIDNKIFYEIKYYYKSKYKLNISYEIAYSLSRINTNYLTILYICEESINIFNDDVVPLYVITDFKISISKSELLLLSKIINIEFDISNDEINFLNNKLNEHNLTLLEIIKNCSLIEKFNTINNKNLFLFLKKIQNIIFTCQKGNNVLIYLLNNLKYHVLNSIFKKNEQKRYFEFNMNFKCIPFDKMPFYFYLPNHRTKLHELLPLFNGRDYEIFARNIRLFIENNNSLFVELNNVKIDNLVKNINDFNNKLDSFTIDNKICKFSNFLFMKCYESNIVNILNYLNSFSNLDDSNLIFNKDVLNDINDICQKNIIESIFLNSRISIIEGAAGTGKTTCLGRIINAKFYNEKILFLTLTHNAKDNIKSKFKNNNNYIFSTIKNVDCLKNKIYKLLVIDEFSIVSNSDFLNVLNNIKFDYLLLIGDPKQIESIEFGNWWKHIKHMCKNINFYELKTIYRTSNENLKLLWKTFRDCDFVKFQNLALKNYTTNDYNNMNVENLYKNKNSIILCSNYSGIYGVHNINKILQSKNKNFSYKINTRIFKIDDPIVFINNQYVRNNSKGIIKDIKYEYFSEQKISISFKILLIDYIFDENNYSNIIKYENGEYYININISLIQEDEIIPFEIAYAMTIHKSQGLEFDDVNILISDSDINIIDFNIIYTAITRAKKDLNIYWTKSTESKIIQNLKLKINNAKKNYHIEKNYLDKNFKK